MWKWVYALFSASFDYSLIIIPIQKRSLCLFCFQNSERPATFAVKCISCGREHASCCSLPLYLEVLYTVSANFLQCHYAVSYWFSSREFVFSSQNSIFSILTFLYQHFGKGGNKFMIERVLKKLIEIVLQYFSSVVKFNVLVLNEFIKVLSCTV